MGRSLSLAAYRALSRRRPADDRPDFPDRPEGEVIWLHANSDVRARALHDIGGRVKSQRPDAHVLLTLDAGQMSGAPGDLSASDWIAPLGSDHPSLSRHFIEHWRPDILFWTGSRLMHSLIAQAAGRAVPMILVDACESDFPDRRRRWLPDLTRETLGRFHKILASSDHTRATLSKSGIAGDKLALTAPLQAGRMPPACLEETLSAATEMLSGRPVWLAVQIAEDEVEPVLIAHQAAVRRAHRLLLIVTCKTREGEEKMAAALEQSRLRHGHWRPGAQIDDNTQVLITDQEDELGLWYRLAPITFLGDSLNRGGRGRSPLDAAALGSAILFGPNVRAHMDEFARLTAAGAARTVRSPDALAANLIELIAPDRAAAMALAGWEIATMGAELTDELVEMAHDLMDLRGAGHAGS